MLALGSLKRRFDSDSDSDSEVDSDAETGEDIFINHNDLKRFKFFFILKSVLSLEGDSQLPSFSRRIGNQQRDRREILKWAAHALLRTHRTSF